MRPAAATVATGLIGEAGHLLREMARLFVPCAAVDLPKRDRFIWLFGGLCGLAARQKCPPSSGGAPRVSLFSDQRKK